MKAPQLEILLVTDSRFSARQLCEKYDNGSQNNSAGYKNLVEACWNGCLPEMLPELYEKGTKSKKLILWKIIQGEHFLELEYGEQPQIGGKFFSMNPYSFLGPRLLS